jgi:hypothetical protein
MVCSLFILTTHHVSGLSRLGLEQDTSSQQNTNVQQKTRRRSKAGGRGNEKFTRMSLIRAVGFPKAAHCFRAADGCHFNHGGQDSALNRLLVIAAVCERTIGSRCTECVTRLTRRAQFSEKYPSISLQPFVALHCGQAVRTGFMAENKTAQHRYGQQALSGDGFVSSSCDGVLTIQPHAN